MEIEIEKEKKKAYPMKLTDRTRQRFQVAKALTGKKNAEQTMRYLLDMAGVTL